LLVDGPDVGKGLDYVQQQRVGIVLRTCQSVDLAAEKVPLLG